MDCVANRLAPLKELPMKKAVESSSPSDAEMSYCKVEGGGKDTVIVVTKEDHLLPLSDAVAQTLKIDLDDDDEGPMTKTGEINWECPCMANMIAGPCGYAFREAFSCFHHSEAQPKGMDCMKEFTEMRACFDKYPTVYPPSSSAAADDDEGDDDDDEGDMFGLSEDDDLHHRADDSAPKDSSPPSPDRRK